uniref:Proteasome assembly chaperone 1 n=1 Tax=Molossus molossus TaxID=27622 RepID=A0A7J8I283_MOLMO|nr:proteasome assembly chaperone 1 [Molossus molossus]
MAATFFGEVVKAPCRAGTEDEEEDEGNTETPEDREVRRKLARKREVRILRRQTKTSLDVSLLEKYPCSKFIIAVGNNAVAFLSSFVMNSGVWEEVGSAKLWNEWCRTTDTEHLSPAEAFCVFYHLKSNPSVLLCQCSCYVAEDQQYQWLEKVGERCGRERLTAGVAIS